MKLFNQAYINFKSNFNLFLIINFIVVLMQAPRNIVVTGGNSGIGLYAVKGLYEDGNHVIFGSRNQQKNEEVAKEIAQKPGGSLKCFPLDLSKRKSIEEFVKNVKVALFLT